MKELEKHEDILPVKRSSTKHSWQHLVFFWLHEESIGVAHAFTNGLAGFNLSDVTISSCVWKQSARYMGWTQSFLHVIGTEHAPSSPPNLFFAWSRLFTVITLRRPCEWIEKHEGILPVTRWSTKHCWQHLVFFWLREETIEVVRAVLWGRNRNRCEICWTPSTLLYAFMILYASRIALALVYQVYHSKK